MSSENHRDQAPDREPSADDEIENTRIADVCEATLPLSRNLPGATAPEPWPNERKTISRYILLEKIGSGAMGEIYAAFDPELERKIAIKLLRRRTNDERARRRLLREAQAMAKLSHPHVVPIYDVGTTGDDLFVAMERIRDGDLANWLKEQPRNWREILRVFEQAGDGLRAAHAAGLVHRDFKPENVLICSKKGAQVTDFGLARSALESLEETKSAVFLNQFDDSSPLRDNLTETGALVGTPAYMAPELYNGEAADAKTDQFAYCVAFWQALYGRRPFVGKSIIPLMEAIQAGKVTAPPASAAKTVPIWLHRILLRGLSPKPEDRWPSMTALLDALRRNRGHLKSRRRLLIAAALVAAATGTIWHATAVGGTACRDAARHWEGVWDHDRRTAVQRAVEGTGLTYASTTWQQIDSVLNAYTSRWNEVCENACETHRRHETSGPLYDRQMACLHARRSEVDALVEILTEPDAATLMNAVRAADGLSDLETCTDSAALLAKVPPPEDAETAALVERQRSKLQRIRYLYSTGSEAAAVELLEDILPEIRALPYPPLHAEALHRLGFLKLHNFEDSEAEKLLNEAWQIALEYDHDELTAIVATDLINLYGHSMSEFDQAEIWVANAQALTRKLTNEPDILGGYLRAMGAYAGRRGDFRQALEHHQQALKVVGARHAPDSTFVARAHNSIGRAYAQLGQWSSALEAFNTAYRIYADRFGRHPIVAGYLVNLSNAHAALGRVTEERQNLLEALEIFRESHGSDHVLVGRTLANLGISHFQNTDGDPKQARIYLEESVSILRQQLGEDHIDVARALVNLGHALLANDLLAEAEQRLDEATAIYLRRGHSEHPTYGIALSALGQVHLRQGRHQQAVRELSRALALRPPESTSPFSIAEMKRYLAEALWEGDEKTRALEVMQDSLITFRASEQQADHQIREIESWLADHAGQTL